MGRGRRGEGGSGGSTAFLPSPFPSPYEGYESSLSNHGTVTVNNHIRGSRQELYPFDLANVTYCYYVNP